MTYSHMLHPDWPRAQDWLRALFRGLETGDRITGMSITVDGGESYLHGIYRGDDKVQRIPIPALYDTGEAG